MIYGKRSKKKYSIANLDPKTDYDMIFYKEQWIDQGSFEGKLIVTYSLKYQIYQRNIRNEQIERARRAIAQGSARIRKKRQNDFMRFVDKISVTDDGEVASKDKYCLDNERITEEERYDGYYAVVSNLDDEACDIIKVNKQRWKIEECFRIMKTEFKSRPVYVQKDNRIEAHFITCFLALVIYRYLEKKLNYQYTCDQLIDTLQNMDVRELVGEGYLPAYTRTDITDALHDAFGFRTDYQAITKAKMKKILKETKPKIRHAKF